MFSVAVKEFIMIAHSLKGECFGPAQNLHGATFVVTSEYKTNTLNSDGVVIDIGIALEALKSVLAHLNYRNLDELPCFEEKNTTTEYLCQYIHSELSKVIGETFKGLLKITLEESHAAWGSYEAKVE